LYFQKSKLLLWPFTSQDFFFLSSISHSKSYPTKSTCLWPFHLFTSMLLIIFVYLNCAIVRKLDIKSYFTLHFICTPIKYSKIYIHICDRGSYIINYIIYKCSDNLALSVTWWRLFQKRAVRTKFYIYAFIAIDN
jgi:hypothetical protein